MYQTINQLKKGYQYKFSMIGNKKGELTMNAQEKAEIWKEYFDKVLNTEEPEGLIKRGNKEIREIEVEELTERMEKSGKKLKKNNKAA